MKQQNHQWVLWALSDGKWGISYLSHLGHKAEKEKKKEKEHMRLHLGHKSAELKSQQPILLPITLKYKYENLILSCLHPQLPLSSLSLAAATLLSLVVEQLSLYLISQLTTTLALSHTQPPRSKPSISLSLTEDHKA
jgi:hypothetical protein